MNGNAKYCLANGATYDGYFKDNVMFDYDKTMY